MKFILLYECLHFNCSYVAVPAAAMGENSWSMSINARSAAACSFNNKLLLL